MKGISLTGYTLLFAGLLSVINNYKLKITQLSWVNMFTNAFTLLVFLVSGLYYLSELRDMTLAINMGKVGADSEEHMNISMLREKLNRRGLEVDGTRETLIKRLKEFNETEDSSDDSSEEDSDDEEDNSAQGVGDEDSTGDISVGY